MNLTEICSRLGDVDPAVAEAIENLATRTTGLLREPEQMTIDDPVILRSELVSGLRQLADSLADMDRLDDEVRARRIVHDLCEPQGGVQLAMASSELAGPLTSLGQLDEAVTLRRRSFHLLRDLAKADGDLWRQVAAEADLYSDLLSRTGRTLDAAMVCHQVVSGLARLVDTGSEWAREPYALALKQYGQRLAEDGELEEGVLAAEKAVAQFRKLGDGYSLTLALNLLGDLHSKAGNHDTALTVAHEALDEAERLGPGDYRMTVAMALQSVGIRYGALERWPEARDSLLKAREQFAVLLAEDPEVARWFAPCLDDLVHVYGQLQDTQLALEVAEEATALYRRLVEADHQTWLPELALSLSNLGHRYRDADRGSRAVYATQESIKYYRRLMAADQIWTVDLARTLTHLGNHLAAAGQQVEAVDVLRESVAFFRQCPDFEQGLGLALKTLGITLRKIGKAEESCEFSAEAVEIFRSLEDLPQLSATLFDLAIAHDHAEQLKDALGVAREAAEVYQHLYDEDAGWAAALANALGFFGSLHEQAGRFDYAITAAERAVSLLERLYEPGEDDLGGDLARALHNLSRYHEQEGRLEWALGHMKRAVRLYGELTQQDPERFRTRLASAWISLGIYHRRLDQPEEARSAAQLAADLYREAGDPEGLSDALFHLSNREKVLGHTEESIIAMQAALEKYEELSLVYPDPYLAKMAMALDNLAAMHDPAEALPLLRRADDIWSRLENGPRLVGTLDRQLFVLSCLDRDTQQTIERIIDLQQDLAASIRTLNDVAQELLRIDLHESAHRLLDRAAALWEIHLLQEPDAAPFPLIHVLDSMATLRARQGRPEDAAAAEMRVVELIEPLAKEEPDEYLGPLSVMLNRLARYLREADHITQALPHQRRAVEIDERIAALNPAHRGSLVESLINLGHLLEDISSEESAKVLTRAATLRAALPDAVD
jgi:tetratricopeptide (TPR) repeat protein